MTSNSRSPSAVSMPGLGDPHDRRPAQVDQRDGRVVVRLVVPGDERRSLLAEPVVLRDQLLRGLRVRDDAADLLGDELAPRGVRRRVEEQVGVVARQLREARAGPHRLEERAPLGVGVVERRAVVRLVEEARDRRVQHLADRRELGAELRLLLGGDRPVVERRAPVGGALVDGQRRGHLRDHRDDLHAAGAGADDRDPLAREVDRRRRPPAGVVLLAAEVVPPGARRGRTAPRARRSPRPGTAPGPPLPSSSVTVHRAVGLVERRRGDGDAEAHVAAEVEAVDHVVEVALGLGLLGEVLLPLPLVEELLREEVAVRVALGVEARARVAVPVPRAADATAGLDQRDREARLAGAVQLVDAGDARPRRPGRRRRAARRSAGASGSMSDGSMGLLAPERIVPTG